MDPIDQTKWCPRDVAIKKTWRYCLDCDPRRKAGRCPYMWLYWERKKLREGDPPPPLEMYERVCAACESKLSLHAALIHLLNASGYRKINVDFDHKKYLATFENCPYCFTGVGWFPGKPEPEIQLSPEQEMELEIARGIEAKLNKTDDKPEERHKQISQAIKKHSEIDTGFVKYVEYDGANIGFKDEVTVQKPVDGPKRRITEKPEWIYPEESGLDAANVSGEVPARHGEEHKDWLDNLQKVEPEMSFRSPDNDVELAFHEDSEPIAKAEDVDPDPHYDGIPRCPEHEHRNADRNCPLCHRTVCRECMAFINGVYACRTCFGDYKIRQMYDIPKDWESLPPIDLAPEPVAAEVRRFGIVPIQYEGMPAKPGHRFLAHVLDATVAAGILGSLQYIFSNPLNGLITWAADTVVALSRQRTLGEVGSYFDAERAAMPFTDMQANEVLGRSLGFGWLFDIGIPPHLAWWVAGLPLLTWYFMGFVPVWRIRSLGQQLCNLVVVGEDGHVPELPIRLLRMLYSIIGILSCGSLAFLSYFGGPAAGIGFLDSLSSYRIVTFSGMRDCQRRGQLVRIAALPPKKVEAAESARQPE